MRTIVAYTEEIDDLDLAVESLFMQTRDFVLARNSMAILYTEEETDYAALYARLKERWSFPIIGCTAMAMLTGLDGYCRGGISVMLLTADDCRFSVGMTGELGAGDYETEIAKLYGELKAQHDTEVKLCLSYFGISLTERKVTGGNLLSALDRAAGGLPIYGGVAADNLSFTGFRVFYNDREVVTGMALALLSGNINPRYVRVNSINHTARFSYDITRAEDNVLYRVGDDTFVDALKKENMSVAQGDVMPAYIMTPFMVSVDHGDGDRTEAARIISSMDLETGSGMFMGVMPEGATLGIGLINHEDVCSSVQKAFDHIFQELAQPGAECSTLLCTSCGARYLALVNDPAAEANTYLDRLPEGVSLMGFYAYGECCPVQGKKTGKEYNMFHNFTFTILAL